MPRLNLVLAACSALALAVLPGLASAGASPPPPVGSYTFSGSCNFGCSGTATGALEVGSTLAGSSFSMAYFNQPLLVQPDGGSAALNVVANTNLPFGPLQLVSFETAVSLPFSGGATANIGSAGFALGTSVAGDWQVFNASSQQIIGGTNGIWVAQVPEAQTLAMMLAGLGVVGFLGRRRQVATAR